MGTILLHKTPLITTSLDIIGFSHVVRPGVISNGEHISINLDVPRRPDGQPFSLYLQIISSIISTLDHRCNPHHSVADINYTTL